MAGFARESDKYRVAVFLKRSGADGSTKYVREQYNLVRDKSDGPNAKTFVEPIGNRPIAFSATSEAEDKEEYDEVRFYTEPPYLKSRIGGGW